MVFEYVEVLNLKYSFNMSLRLVGCVWFEGFVVRNNIFVWKFEVISINRVMVFNKIEV